jgi:hypothetical protein
MVSKHCSRNLPSFESRKFIVAITKSQHCSLSRDKVLIRTIQTNLFKAHFNIILISTFQPAKVTLKVSLLYRAF